MFEVFDLSSTRTTEHFVVIGSKDNETSCGEDKTFVIGIQQQRLPRPWNPNRGQIDNLANHVVLQYCSSEITHISISISLPCFCNSRNSGLNSNIKLLNCLVLINAFCENIQKSIARIGNADSATVLMSVLGQAFDLWSAYCWSAFSPFGIRSWNMKGVQIVSWKSIDIRIAASCGRGEFEVAQKVGKEYVCFKVSTTWWQLR